MDYFIEDTEWPNVPSSEEQASLGRPVEKQSRKRKIDKDGFLKPLTPDSLDSPDLPMSRQYEPRIDNFDNQSNVYAVPVKFADGDEERTWGDWKQGDTVELHCEQAQSKQQKTDNSIKAGAAGDETNKQNCSEPTVSVESEIKNLAKEYQSAMSTEWLPVFQESEQFEYMCPTRLDNLIHQAEEIEKTLGHQKDVICNRLQGLGKVLHV